MMNSFFLIERTRRALLGDCVSKSLSLIYVVGKNLMGNLAGISLQNIVDSLKIFIKNINEMHLFIFPTMDEISTKIREALGLRNSLFALSAPILSLLSTKILMQHIFESMCFVSFSVLPLVEWVRDNDLSGAKLII